METNQEQKKWWEELIMLQAGFCVGRWTQGQQALLCPYLWHLFPETVFPKDLQYTNYVFIVSVMCQSLQKACLHVPPALKNKDQKNSFLK